MNKQRRNKIRKALAEYLKEEAPLREALLAVLHEARDEEEDAFENLSEFLQDSEKGEAMQDAISALEDLISETEEGPFCESIEALKETVGIYLLCSF